MKLNISNPATGCQKIVEVDDERKLRAFYDKHMSQEIDGDVLGDDFRGYVFKIAGGNDKQGFPMMQGILLPHRVRLLLKKGSPCYRQRRTGERKRKSVRGCIVGPDLAVLNLVIVKKGEGELPGLTDRNIPRRLGPKRATKIRSLFNLTKQDDVRKYVIRRQITREGKKTITKAPKIQRLITSVRLQRKRAQKAEKKDRVLKSKAAAAEYAASRRAERIKEKNARESARRRSSNRPSQGGK